MGLYLLRHLALNRNLLAVLNWLCLSCIGRLRSCLVYTAGRLLSCSCLTHSLSRLSLSCSCCRLRRTCSLCRSCSLPLPLWP